MTISIHVHQTLHGYSDGHRLLAGSAQLVGRDGRTMLALSDVSDPGARIPDEGYLTGYPLVESGLYALAKTWPAPEKSRPGCVWTHTLLLEFSELATVSRPELLLKAYCRPGDEQQTFSNYALPVDLPSEDGEFEENWQADTDLLRRLLFALYSKPRDKVIAAAPFRDLTERIVLEIWAQQWPRLRRSFRFCTLAFADRSVDAAAFDLQILPMYDRSARSRFSAAVDADSHMPPYPDWVSDALDDIVHKSNGKLRGFLRQVGGDVTGGREAFAPLCRLCRLLKINSPAAMDEAATLLQTVIPLHEARSARTMVAIEASRRAGDLSEAGLAFVLSQIDLLDDDEFGSVAEPLGRAIWTRAPSIFSRSVTASGRLRELAERSVRTLSDPEVAVGMRRLPELRGLLLALRPEVTALPEFWEAQAALDDAVLTALHLPERINPAIRAMVRSGARLADQAVSRFGAVRVLSIVLEQLDGSASEFPARAELEWLAISARDGAPIAQVLSNPTVHRRTSLVALARTTSPDLVPNEYGEDPWFSALRTSTGSASDQDRQYLASYILSRALGYRSRNQAELIAFAFDDVYFAAHEGRLFDEAWRLLEKRLPWAWWDQDHCRRLRSAVVDAFVSRELAPAVFARVTTDDEVFEALAETASDSFRGRAFLRQVQRSIQETAVQLPSIRLKTIERLT
jgi:hypothetical protein